MRTVDLVKTLRIAARANSDNIPLTNLLAIASDKLDELSKGEYVCQKCGLRKDGTYVKGDF